MPFNTANGGEINDLGHLNTTAAADDTLHNIRVDRRHRAQQSPVNQAGACSTSWVIMHASPTASAASSSPSRPAFGRPTRALVLALSLGPLACAGDDGRELDGPAGSGVTKADDHEDGGDGSEPMIDGVPVACHPEELAAAGYAVEWHEAELHSERTAPADFILIHETEGSTFEGAITSLTGSRASVHYVVGPAGEIACLVRTSEEAEQVTNAEFDQRALGIELVGMSHVADTSEAQMSALAALVGVLADAHGIERDRDHVIAHIEVPKEDDAAGCGGNSGHYDPGTGFDYGDLMTRLGVPPEYPVIPDQYMSWVVTSPSERIVLAPGEQRLVSFDLVNTGIGAWEQGFLKLIASDDVTKRFRAPSWQTEDVILPMFEDGTTGQCFGPLREATLSLEITTPATFDCAETEQPCIRTLTFYAYAQLRPEGWKAYPSDFFTLEVELSP